MTILQKARQTSGHAGRRWYKFGDPGVAVRHTDVWEHETFAEEQARWERSDPEYARLCEDVRRAKDGGEEASRRADEAKAEWDARVAKQRQANDDARRAHHVHTAFAIESDESPASGIIPESVRVHDELAATTARRGERRAARFRFRGPATRNPVSDERSRLGLE
jgi:hypothetical protein